MGYALQQRWRQAMMVWSWLQERAVTATDDDMQDETGPLAVRYLVTFIKSQTTDPLRSATVVSVMNLAERTC